MRWKINIQPLENNFPSDLIEESLNDLSKEPGLNLVETL